MEILKSIEDLRNRRSLLQGGETLGFVPTMGYLHAGHLSLVEMARKENSVAAVSIFVNPTQFGPKEDLSRYPRDMERDLSMLESAGVDWVFTPLAEEIYPPGYSTYVDVRDVTEPLEGAARPGHFLGVATVVGKLFNLVQPHRAYFGQKDAQQVAVIRRMVRDLNFPVELFIGATLREPDGLAMSSRNVYLNPNERRAATALYRSLDAAKALWESGERRGSALRDAMTRTLDVEPLANPDYVSVADPNTLRELDDTGVAISALASLAVRIGNTRLIDNFLFA